MAKELDINNIRLDPKDKYLTYRVWGGIVEDPDFNPYKGLHRPSTLNLRTLRSPDGEDKLYKAFHSAKGVGICGLYVGFVDALLMSHQKTTSAILGKMVSYGVPGAATGATYAIATNIIGEMRQKDGPFNHFLGSVVSGAVAGAAFGSIPVGITWSVLFGVSAAWLKMDRMLNMGLAKHPLTEVKKIGGYEGNDFFTLWKRKPSPEVTDY